MIRGKRVFITGGAFGIGKALVRAFCSAGALVAYCDINAPAHSGSDENGVRYFMADISDAGQLSACMETLFEEWGDMDVIVNNAGVFDSVDITDTGITEFDRIININLRPVFITSRMLAIHRKNMKGENLYGRIINICSTRYLMSEAGTEAYSASKGGIYSLTHALAVSLGEYHITVNSVSPGWIENSNYDRLTAGDHRQHPSGRVGKPEDIASMCIFLCGEENDFINGENITIDGGMTKKMIYT